MNILKIIPALAAFAVAAPAAAQAEEAKSTAQDIAWQSQQQIYLSGLKTSDGWHYEEGGVRWRWLDYNGSQKRPLVTDTVTVHYEGKLIDGTVFDSSYERDEPAEFPLNRLVKGWQLAIPKMGVGETIEIAIPADQAYGPVGRGPIPGNATLVFKVELLGFKK